MREIRGILNRAVSLDTHKLVLWPRPRGVNEDVCKEARGVTTQGERDTRHETRDTRHETRDTRHKTRDTRHETRDTRRANYLHHRQRLFRWSHPKFTNIYWDSQHPEVKKRRKQSKTNALDPREICERICMHKPQRRAHLTQLGVQRALDPEQAFLEALRRLVELTQGEKLRAGGLASWQLDVDFGQPDRRDDG